MLEIIKMLEINIGGILIAYITFLVAIISPGPANMLIANFAMREGKLPALAVASGVVIGSFFWGTVTFAGLSAILLSQPNLVFAIKIGGGFYLLWLAYKMFRSALRSGNANFPQNSSAKGFKRQFILGLALHLTNPKAPLAWIAIIALAFDSRITLLIGFVVVAGTTILAIIVYGGIALVFSTEPIVRGYLRHSAWIDGITSIVFALASVSLLLTVIN